MYSNSEISAITIANILDCDSLAASTSHSVHDMIAAGLEAIDATDGAVEVSADLKTVVHFDHATRAYWRTSVAAVAHAGRMVLDGEWDYSLWCSETDSTEV